MGFPAALHLLPYSYCLSLGAGRHEAPPAESFTTATKKETKKEADRRTDGWNNIRRNLGDETGREREGTLAFQTSVSRLSYKKTCVEKWGGGSDKVSK